MPSLPWGLCGNSNPVSCMGVSEWTAGVPDAWLRIQGLRNIDTLFKLLKMSPCFVFRWYDLKF